MAHPARPLPTSTPTPRNATIDVARGLGMLAIVWGHNAYTLNLPAEMFRVVFSFHVPLFFCLAGAMLRTGITPWAHMVRRARGLLQPYVVVLTCLALVGAWKQWRAGGDWAAHALGSLAGMAWGTGTTLPWPPLWFLPHLLLASLATLLWLNACHRLRPGNTRLPLLSALALLATGIATMGHMDARGLPWSIDLLPISMAYMLLGHTLRARIAKPHVPWWGLLAMLAAFAALHGLWDETINLNLRQHGQAAIATAQALLGIACVMGVAKALAGRVAWPLAYLGRQSLAVLVLHVYVQDNVTWALQRATGQPTLHADIALVALVAACTLPLLVWAAAARWSVTRQLLMPGTTPPR